MFVLDHVPSKYLKGGPEKSVVVFTAGWAMKFVPLLGQALKDLAIDGHSRHALDQFKITRKNPTTHEALIIE
jgi:sarcosine oxidase/L-pipecolate oxidase